MQQWLRRIRGVVGMGLVWAVGGLFAGGLIELLDNILPGGLPGASIIDMWPQTLAILAFPRGIVFGTVLGLAKGRRGFDEFSLPQFAAWGAVAGLVLGALAMANGAGLIFLGVSTLASAIAGAASLALARKAEERGLLASGSSLPASPPQR